MRWWWLLALLAVALLGVPARAAPPAPLPPQVDDYGVGPGDVLRVEVYGEPDLSADYTVSDAGGIDFPLLGVVEVGGLTTREVAELLRARLGDGFIVSPVVTVRVAEFGSQPVQVLGAVQKPGTYTVPGTATVLDVLARAGGIRGEGVSEIRVTRGDRVTTMSYADLVERGAGDLRLHGGDVVFVVENVVFVSGEVNRPGSVPWRDDLTVSQAIAEAGGARPTANLRRVTVLRDGEPRRVNVRRVLRGRAPDPPLVAGDQVFVPESVL